MKNGWGQPAPAAALVTTESGASGAGGHSVGPTLSVSQTYFTEDLGLELEAVKVNVL